MGLSGIGSVSPASSVSASSGAASTASGGGGLPFSVGTTAAGGAIAQGSGAPGQGGGAGSLIKKVLIGGVLGAGLGFGASFLTLPVIGQVAAPIAAAVGAGVGVLGALAVHFIGKRKQNLAMQQQAQAATQSAMQPTPSPQGVTLRMNARGGYARKLQNDLHALGLYKGPLNGTFDKATSEAVKKYEVMKGVMPTGKASPDVRAAVSQDVALVKQYA